MESATLKHTGFPSLRKCISETQWIFCMVPNFLKISLWWCVLLMLFLPHRCVQRNKQLMNKSMLGYCHVGVLANSCAIVSSEARRQLCSREQTLIVQTGALNFYTWIISQVEVDLPLCSCSLSAPGWSVSHWDHSGLFWMHPMGWIPNTTPKQHQSQGGGFLDQHNWQLNWNQLVQTKSK